MTIDGALLLDKPRRDQLEPRAAGGKAAVRRSKAGHAGTLDPLASGLLVVLFGEATKFAGQLLEDDKEYLATLKLGEKTATGDAEGEVIERKAVQVSRTRSCPRVADASRARSSSCRRCTRR